MSKIPDGVKAFVVISNNDNDETDYVEYFETEKQARDDANMAITDDKYSRAVIAKVVTVYERSSVPVITELTNAR